jgi:hypothetical protein
MASHLLDSSLNAHLTACNVDNRVDEVKIGQLAVRTIVNDVELVISLLMWIVDGEGSLKRARLERQWRNIFGIMRVMVSVHPGLRARFTVWR